jgi:DNA repair exonuclease SbcCD ATPase subunit
MHVRRVELHNFTRHEAFSLDLPERGVVLVTGPNGSGKSSVVEAVCVALWGKTLRGAHPWVEGKKGHVGLWTDVVAVDLVCQPDAKANFSWMRVGGHPTEYSTLTKARQALEEVIGPFELWRQSHVFSSADAARFTLATDAERKRLLEGVLGLGRFDRAADAAREAVRETAGKTQGAAIEHASCSSRVNMAVTLHERLATLRAADVGMTEADARTRVVDLEREIKMLREAGRSAPPRELLASDKCPTCGQKITGARRLGIERKCALADEAHKKMAHAEEERDEARSRLDKVRQHAFTMASVDQQTVEELSVKEAALAEAEKALATTATAHQTAQAVAAVLGPRGVRAHVLGRALGGLEAVSNAYLGRLGLAGLSVQLKPYTEKASGGVQDAISLEVDGAGGGHGYKGASGGERRRIDVALMLALADVASAAAGKVGGTLFFDEVLDALDADGVDAVVGCLEELATERAVVVISHSEALANRLRPAKHVRLER